MSAQSLATMACRIVHATAPHPGAIAIVQLVGNSQAILSQLIGAHDWPIGRMRLCMLADIDEGIVVRLSADVAQIMPHGGPRIMQLLTARLMDLGCELVNSQQLHPRDLFPEAQDDIEALMMAALAQAESPLAIDLLLDQPRRWRELRTNGKTMTGNDLDRAVRLNRLLNPPLVVLAGRPNVGKSTLSNALLGRSMSIALDMPGTTRDYTAGRIDLAGMVVDWFDTPGLRETSDPIERKSIEIASRLISRADVLIAMRDPQIDWPPLPRTADVFVLNKIDNLDGSALIKSGNGGAPNSPLPISAARKQGLQALVETLGERLVPQADRDHPGPWMFDERLSPTIERATSKNDHSRLTD